MAKKKATGFSVRLRELRVAGGLTQAELAERAGMHLHGITKLEQGDREPSWATVQVLARALGVGCEAFQDAVGGSEASPDITAAESPKPPQGKASDPPAAGLASPAALQAVGKLMEGLPHILSELKQWGHAHEAAMSPVAIRILHARLEKLFNAARAAAGGQPGKGKSAAPSPPPAEDLKQQGKAGETKKARKRKGT